MFYPHMNERPVRQAKSLTKGFLQSNSCLIPTELVSHKSGAGACVFGRAPPTSTCKGSALITDLTVATDFLGTGEGSQCCSGGSSPPPPALSPASSSPTNLMHNLFNHTSSPSPPVIVAEIVGQSSASSRANSEKNLSHPVLAREAACKPSVMPSPSTVEERTSQRPCSAPRLTSLSPCSSSSSVSSVKHVGNGLPILEKISIVMGSPPKSLPENQTRFSLGNANAIPEGNLDSPIAFRSPNISIPVSLAPSECQVQCHRLEQVHTDAVKVSVKEEITLPQRGKCANRGTRKRSLRNITRRRRRTKQRPGDSDSDFAFGRTTGGLSRGRSHAVAAFRRIKQRSTRKKANEQGTTGDPRNVLSTEAAANRRYLESPFLCLCQSGSTVASLSRSVLTIQSRPQLSSSLLAHNPSDPIESVFEAASMPAHIISPALRGMTVTGSSLTNSHASIPPCCPLNVGLGFVPQKTTENVDTRTVFSGISYKPSVQQRLRDIQQSLESGSNQTVWLCAFCGEDNNFLSLGGLYGPYYVTASEKAQIIPECVAQLSISPRTPGSHSPGKNSRSGKKGKPAGSGVITSTLTRSAAAQGRSTVANMGALRLVIKAPNNKTVTEKVSNLRPRISADGEVWVHLECALWAPGTYIVGDGTIGGLGEALQLSLDTICSHCDKRGAILNCCSRGCNLRYHYHCAIAAECQLDHEQYTLLCKKHLIYC
ncbi:Transcription factor 20 [Fasciola gigantica]|uniref:Transcription factor 20 n=1 Tax=Fasciola gigantica TaxID=46835 RepID=A0A504Z173_FASGI|nr:Transcription factor 20 [Fasciola gigantica]